jgi:hypothetical protein
VFTVEQRDAARAWLLDLATTDERVVAAAAVGGSAGGERDRWSDIDLTFGVAESAVVAEVLDDWTSSIVAELDGTHLFDLPAWPAIYRVFLLPGCLQVDISFSPADAFGAAGPRFELLFGEALERPEQMGTSAVERFGLAVHHAVRARVNIERGRSWQAEYWLSSLRDEALTLACRRRGLNGVHGRGVDELPAEVLTSFQAALARSIDEAELGRALAAAIDCLLRESDDTRGLGPSLRALSGS